MPIKFPERYRKEAGFFCHLVEWGFPMEVLAEYLAVDPRPQVLFWALKVFAYAKEHEFPRDTQRLLRTGPDGGCAVLECPICGCAAVEVGDSGHKWDSLAAHFKCGGQEDISWPPGSNYGIRWVIFHGECGHSFALAFGSQGGGLTLSWKEVVPTPDLQDD